MSFQSLIFHAKFSVDRLIRRTPIYISRYDRNGLGSRAEAVVPRRIFEFKRLALYQIYRVKALS